MLYFETDEVERGGELVSPFVEHPTKLLPNMRPAAEIAVSVKNFLRLIVFTFIIKLIFFNYL
jgi:hypothetical protein